MYEIKLREAQPQLSAGLRQLQRAFEAAREIAIGMGVTVVDDEFIFTSQQQYRDFEAACREADYMKAPQ